MTAPLVSLIIPAYNRVKILAESVQSACAQTVKDIEIILIDNASTDGTWDLCQALARQDPRIRIFRQDTNTGPIGNWQRCMAEAQGHFVKCVWSDDLITPDSLEKTLPYLIDPSVGLVFNAARIFNEAGAGEVLYAQHGDRPGTLSSDDYIRYMLYKQGATVPNSPVASLFRLKDLREAVLMEVPSPTIDDFPAHSMGTDVLAHLLVARRYAKVAFVPEPMTMFRSHQDSITTWALTEAADKWTNCYQQVKIWFTQQYQRPLDTRYLIVNEWIRRSAGAGQPTAMFAIAQQFLFDPAAAGIPHSTTVDEDFRFARQTITGFWQQAPDHQLAELYAGEAGIFYKFFLQSGFNQQPLLPAEEPIVAQLGQTIAQGLDKPGGVQALMGAMLYYPPGKMQVRDAATRIPGWLLPDYQAVFEPGAAVAPAGGAPATPASPPAAPPTAAGGSLETDMVFLNRLLGCANLYYIDPEEVSIAEETRHLRRQVADYWLTVGGDRLEAVYRAEFGQRYRALLTCGIQNAPLTAEEEAFAQQLSARVAQGLEQPAGVAAFLGVMLFYPPGKMQVRDAQNRLPAWLWPDYQAVFELPRDPETPPLQPSAPPVTATPAAPPTAQPVVSIDQAYLDRLLVHVQAYQANPQDAGAIAELRSMRRQLAYVWMGVPTGELEAVYGGVLGDRYRALLRSGIQNVPLIDDEPGFVQQLATQIGYGFEHPEAVKALLGAMLFYAPGQMQVRDAATRLPAWLVPDYQAVFAAPAASPAVPAAAATITTTPIAPTPIAPTPTSPSPTGTPSTPTSTPASAAAPATLDPRFEDLVFLNRLLGCTNLYEIDPTDAETVADLREMRRQTTELWQGLAGDRLAAIYTSEFGRRYRALLASGFQKEPLDDAERQTLQGLAREIAARLEEPAGVKALLAAMAYYAPGTMQVRDAATRLPAWLLNDYRQIFEAATAPA